MQPLVLSPKAWTCMPRSALASLPVMFHEIWVGEDSFSCSKVTVPLTLESPRRTATVGVCQLLIWRLIAWVSLSPTRLPSVGL